MSIFTTDSNIARPSDGAINYRVTEVSADGGAKSGQLKFRWQSSANQYWLPRNSYIQIALHITKRKRFAAAWSLKARSAAPRQCPGRRSTRAARIWRTCSRAEPMPRPVPTPATRNCMARTSQVRSFVPRRRSGQPWAACA